MNDTSQRGSTFVGILIGLVLGLAIALGVAWYINKLPNPFRDRPPLPPPPKVEPVPLKPAPAEASKDGGKESAPGKSDAAEKDKPKADAPAKNEKADKADKADKSDAGAEKKAAKEIYFIQTGSFQNQADADNLKARLALLGLEAAVQSRTLPDKGVWYRVRLGPYSNVDELNTIRGALTQNNIDTVMVRVREAEK